ncbi:MAG: hypothetical protein LBP36_02600 [Oscillospiraceae bacterium]|jgi:hypothetical protein|nr:hypothetical protein [Oscillospiraceae bacterium]
MWKYSDAQKKETLRYHNERITFRVIERFLHIGHNSVGRWVKEATGKIKRIVSRPQKDKRRKSRARCRSLKIAVSRIMKSLIDLKP